jgi:nucleoside-triphosphatase THEP1
MEIVLLTAPRDSGKTSYVKQYIQEKSAGGLAAVKVFNSKQFIGYDAELFSRGLLEKSIPLVRLEELPGWTAYKRFYFHMEIFNQIYNYFLTLTDSVLVLDEIGPMELEGMGHGRLLGKLLERNQYDSGRCLYLVVRSELIEPVQKSFGFSATRIKEL